MENKYFNRISSDLDKLGHTVIDANLNRIVREILVYQIDIPSCDFSDFLSHDLLPKYQPELVNIQRWILQNRSVFSDQKFRRRIVYFNSHNYHEIFQCISLIQFIDNRMIVYQRSGDISKFIDDCRFFIEIAIHQIPYVIKQISIIYGTIHKTYKRNHRY